MACRNGGEVLRKIASGGIDSLSLWEKLIYCLWIADYGMRNAGDLETAREMYPKFQSEAQRAAHHLSLQATQDAFSLHESDLEQSYFSLFDRLCKEVRNAELVPRGNG